MTDLSDNTLKFLGITAASGLTAISLGIASISSSHITTQDVHFQFDGEINNVQIDEAFQQVNDYNELLQEITEKHIAEAAKDSDLNYMGRSRDQMQIDDAQMVLDSPLSSLSHPDFNSEMTVTIDSSLSSAFTKLSSAEARQVLTEIKGDFTQAAISAVNQSETAPGNQPVQDTQITPYSGITPNM